MDGAVAKFSVNQVLIASLPMPPRFREDWFLPECCSKFDELGNRSAMSSYFAKSPICNRARTFCILGIQRGLKVLSCKVSARTACTLEYCHFEAMLI